jgi:hypothetical protein
MFGGFLRLYAENRTFKAAVLISVWMALSSAVIVQKFGMFALPGEF